MPSLIKILSVVLALMSLAFLTGASVLGLGQRFSVDECLTVVFFADALIVYGFIYFGASLSINKIN